MGITYIRMRHFRLSQMILAAVLTASAAYAQVPQQTPPAAVDEPANAGQDALAPLFEALKRERDAGKARAIVGRINSEWSDSGSATVNLLMQWAANAVTDKRNAAALDFLDQATLLQPDYAEAWNRRAGLHYVMGNRRKSMADINQVLQREPRHLGALAGMAGILEESGEDELALKAWQRYLTLYPADRDAQDEAKKLSEKLAGHRT